MAIKALFSLLAPESDGEDVFSLRVYNAHFNLALGHIRKAILICNRVLEESADHKEALGVKEEAERVFVLYTEANEAAFEERNYQKALDKSTQILQAYPLNGNALVIQNLSLMSLKDNP